MSQPRRYWLHEIKAREGADINAKYMLASDYDALARDLAACKIARDGFTGASDTAHARVRELEDEVDAAKACGWNNRCRELESALAAERTRRETLEHLLRQIEPYIDSVVCYASTVAEYPPNGLPERIRAALANGGSEHG